MSEHPVPGVDLTACLFGGQAFTWWRTDETIHGIVQGTHVTLHLGKGTWQSTPERGSGWLARYLGEHRTLPGALRDDAHLGPLADKLDGLRLLDQDPWEGFLAFMISPVNNVPRIQECMSRVCARLGAPVSPGYHGVPSAQVVAEAGEQVLRELGLGFRAPRIAAASEAIAAGELALGALADAPLPEARGQLMALDGIGPKVAECILCYALGRGDAFPVDRWVQRAGDALFGGCPSPEEARERWGSRAAMAQQLLFHGARMGLIEGVDASPVSTFDRWRAFEG